MTTVTPVNDLREHSQETTCDCNPALEFHNGEMLLIHNSFDGREAVEQANKVLTESLDSDGGAV